MEPTLNLTPHRGPSVWNEPEARARTMHFAAAAAGAAAGVAITALAWRATPPRRFWIAGLGAASALGALVAGTLGDRASTAVAGLTAKRRARTSDSLDRTLKATFPASDAPAVW